MKTIKIAVLAVAALMPAACSDLEVPDLQRPSIDQLTGSPTPSAVAAAVAGVLDGVGAGVDLALGRNVALYAQFDGDIAGGGGNAYAGSGGIRVSW